MKKFLLWVGIVVYFAFFGKDLFRSFVKIDKLQKEVSEKEKQKKELKKLIEDYDVKIENIKTQFYQEKIARNQLQMALPGEKIYRLIEEN